MANVHSGSAVPLGSASDLSFTTRPTPCANSLLPNEGQQCAAQPTSAPRASAGCARLTADPLSHAPPGQGGGGRVSSRQRPDLFRRPRHWWLCIRHARTMLQRSRGGQSEVASVPRLPVPARSPLASAPPLAFHLSAQVAETDRLQYRGRSWTGGSDESQRSHCCAAEDRRGNREAPGSFSRRGRKPFGPGSGPPSRGPNPGDNSPAPAAGLNAVSRVQCGAMSIHID